VESYEIFETLLALLWIEGNATAASLWRDAALGLVEARSDERLRSILAIVLYILQILSAFVFDIGGGAPNPPGGPPGA